MTMVFSSECWLRMFKAVLMSIQVNRENMLKLFMILTLYVPCMVVTVYDVLYSHSYSLQNVYKLMV
jgi:hypothetical protein